MERLLFSELEAWKNSVTRKPLIIQGARQVGKTWLMKEFGRRLFEKVAYFNFDENKRLAGIFEGDISPKRILFALRAELSEKITEETLIIFDEIQEVPRALSSLKYFAEEAPEYYIVCAGSYMGLSLHQGSNFPVGKVDSLTLYPLSFTEFLSATGNETLNEIIRAKDFSMMKSLKEKFIELLRIYYCVGGMPESVKSFIKNNDFEEIRMIQKNLLNFYKQDFSKHADNFLVTKLNQVWDSIPMQLGKENKKFIYGQIKNGARAKDFEIAIQWLCDCGLIHKVRQVSKPGFPLSSYAGLDAFKIYLNDVGLLCALSDLPSNVIFDKNSLFTEFKGALTEQYVLQQLIADCNINPFYFSKENSQCEVDFLFQDSSAIYPIEVKAEENLQAKSLKVYSQKYSPNKSYRISMSDYREQDWLVNIPLYAVATLKKTKRIETNNLITKWEQIT